MSERERTQERENTGERVRTQDQHIYQNKQKKIFACFIDFKKAFDSIWQ